MATKPLEIRRDDARLSRTEPVRVVLRRALSLALMMMLVINSIPFGIFTSAEEPAAYDDARDALIEVLEDAVPEAGELALSGPADPAPGVPSEPEQPDPAKPAPD